MSEEKNLAAHEIAKLFPALNTQGRPTLEEYKAKYAESIADVGAFWGKEAEERLDWFVPFKQTLQGDFDAGDITWFAGGKLNVSYNAVDRHVLNGKGDQVAIVFEGDEPDDIVKLTYLQVQRKVSQIANALLAKGVIKGDVVTIYMPMIPELAMTMLACARVGAIHSVVFAGFSAEALAQRIEAAQSAYLVSADIGKRGGKTINLKNIVDTARTKLNCEVILKAVMVWERFYDETTEKPVYEMLPKDIRMDELVALQRPYAPPVALDSEDSLFILYTSGSTGKPKGLVHTTGGYALYAAFTTQTSFDLREGDLFACVADCGWITGHSYVGTCWHSTERRLVVYTRKGHVFLTLQPNPHQRFIFCSLRSPLERVDDLYV
jgi:acetyl-CoA synthetase